MSAPKTTKTTQSVTAYLNAIEDDQIRKDCKYLLKIMQEVTGEKAAMWGPGIIGFGTYHYVYASGREGDWPLTGFSPRKQNLTVYIMAGFDRYDTLMQTLGKYKTGKSCLYVKRLSDVDEDVLRALIRESVQYLKTKYGT